MKIFIKVIWSLLFVLFFYNLDAQNNILPSTDYIPPSPAAANFIRYGEIPVDYSTGVPDISIPLYTIECGKLKVPISISYHAGGNKVKDIASPVGLGWVLNATGMISRTILGIDDYHSSYDPVQKDNKTVAAIKQLTNYSSNDPLNSNPLCSDPSSNERKLTLWNMVHGYTETQSDRYNYNFPGKSGVFRFDYITGEPITLPYTPVKIEKISRGVAMDPPFDFKITDVDGTIYIFNKWDFNTDAGAFHYNVCNLAKIISSDRSDSIMFTYDLSEYYNIDDHPQYYHLGCAATYTECPPLTITEHYGNALAGEGSDRGLITYNSRVGCYTSLLTSIISRNAKVILNYSPDRQDIRKNRLTSIVINDLNNSQIKVINFNNNAYFGSAVNKNQRLKLNSIEITNTGQPQVYSFQYNEIELPPYFTGDISHPKRNEDYWGYFNNRNNDSDVPSEYFPTGPNASPYFPNDMGNKNPDAYYMTAAIIKKITYPTKGWTEYQFEANQGLNVYSYNNNTILGGLRVKKIISYDGSGQPPVVKTYKYGCYESGYANSFVRIQRDLFCQATTQIFYACGTGYCGMACDYRAADHYYIYGESFLPLTLANQSTVIYDYVTEYAGDEVNNTGKTTYYYDTPPTDDALDEEYMDNMGAKYKSSFQWDRGTYTPILLEKSEYRNGSNEPVRVTTFEYDDYKKDTFQMGLNIVKCVNYVFLPSYGSEHWYDVDAGGYFYCDTKAFTQLKLLTKQTETIDGVTKTIEYKYENNNHLLPTQKITYNSKNEIITTYLRYPHDFISQSPYDEMVNNRHIWSPLVEKIDKKNNVIPLQSVKTNYSFFRNNTIIAPSTIDVKNGNDPPETRLRYYNYDNKGNVLSVSKENDTRTSYIWGYNQTLPIARVVNASDNEIYYTGFDAMPVIDGWTASTSLDVTRGKTGGTSLKSVNGSSGLIYHFFPKLNINNTNDKKYKYSCWVYSSGPAANLFFFWKDNTSDDWYAGNWNVVYQTTSLTNQWVKLEGEATVPSSTKQIYLRADNTNTGTVWFDDLRLCPSDAQMTTYTYSPLIGMTSSTDQNNQTTYYNYDPFGRLQTIKDKDQNFLKRYNYHYQGQAAEAQFTPAISVTNTSTIGKINFSGSDGINSANTTYLWNFGDGSTSTSKTGTHQYTKNNTYTVTLTVSNPDFESYQLQKNVSFANSYNPNFTFSVNGGTVSFSCTDGVNSSSFPTVYNLSFGDNTYGGGSSCSHSYAESGTYTVTLNAINSFFGDRVITKQIPVTVNSIKLIINWYHDGSCWITNLTAEGVDLGKCSVRVIEFYCESFTSNECTPQRYAYQETDGNYEYFIPDDTGCSSSYVKGTFYYEVIYQGNTYTTESISYEVLKCQ